MDPAEYPAENRAKYPAEYPLPVDLAEYPASTEPERLASIRQWIPQVSRQSSSPVWFCLMPLLAHSWVYISCWCLLFFECTLRLGKGDAFVLLLAVNKELRLIPRRVSVWKGLGFC